MFDAMVGRIPVMDVSPVVAGGSYPAKAAVGEPFLVSALVFREGHDALNADVVLTDPQGRRQPWVRMHKDPDGVDLWTAEVAADSPGPWTFEIEAWSDPVATWRHNAEIKIPAGIDVELMFLEGALLLERAAAGLPKKSPARAVLADAVKGVKDTSRPDQVRYAAAVSPAVDEVLAQHPLRDLVTTDGPYRFVADRERALFGSWYEFFPRSEGAYVDAEDRHGGLRHVPHRGRAARGRRRDGLRHHLPPAHPPDRRGQPQGPQQHAHPGPGRPGVAVGDRLQARRPRRRAPRPRDARRLRRVREAGQGGRPRGRPRPGPAGRARTTPG